MRKTPSIAPSFTFVLGFLLVLSPSLFAQQLPHYTQWASHQLSLNPAHAGIKPCIDIHSLYRNQWTGFDGAPKSGFFTASAPISTAQKKLFSPRYGLGARLETDKIGQFSSNRFNIAFASHFNFSKLTRLSLGIYAGIVQMGYDPSNATTIQPDPTVMSETNYVAPDASFGAWWNGENYYFGLTVQNLIASKWNNIGTSSYYRLHSTLNGGFRYAFSKSVTLLPAFLLKIPPGGTLALDLNFLLDFNNTVGFGLGYRNTDALLFLVNFKLLDQLSVHYSFDFTTSPLRSNNTYSHEISLSYTTCKSKKTGAVNCPLF
jgi:type IX secretion system PorP/SprF family membrane protein